jgi:Glycosyl hydrolase-like 10
MRLRISHHGADTPLHISFFLLAGLAPAATLTYQADAPAPWPAILSSIGLVPGKGGVMVAAGDEQGLGTRVEQGTILILEGESATAESFGFRATQKRVDVRAAEDLRAPKLDIVWEQDADLRVFEIPQDARVFMRERHEGAPLMAGLRRGLGAVLWMATSPGDHGYERFPYLPQALTDLGLTPPFRSQNLWAFFDSSYRLHVDVDYFAPKWRAAGIAALHVAAWHYWERNPQADDYLRRLIEACHRNGIQVYAWFELPHVSDKFWEQHPEWRERTALLQDAQLDWRKLMNLTNPDAARAVSQGVADLVNRFDWDGINLAELYFESLEGYDNAARFTPMNNDVREAFRKLAGFDPRDLFDSSSPRYLAANTAGLKRFLDFRADLAARQQAEWIAQAEQLRKAKPHLDLTLTHVDDRFDPSMREKIGADVSRTLPLLAAHDFTFLIEDPATVWNLGPQRYPQIAARYKPLTPRQDRLAIDINVVERYQDVYPTKQQTGVELFQLVHQAELSFARTALYFEHSILPADWSLLSAAASAVERVEQAGSKWVVQARHGMGAAWQGPVLVDGKLWPVSDGFTAWLPAGTHSIEPSPDVPPLRIESFNGELKSAAVTASGIEFAYSSSARALARLDRVPARVEIDGVEVPQPEFAGKVLLLPRGQHLVALSVAIKPTPGK